MADRDERGSRPPVLPRDPARSTGERHPARAATPCPPFRDQTMSLIRTACTAAFLSLSATVLPAQHAHGAQPGDSAAVVAAVNRYHEALASGDSAAALALLAPDAIVLESGGQETREEYRGHHLPGDIAFARAVRSERGPVRVRIGGDVAWATSTSVTQGEFSGRAINSAGAELMVLVRAAQGWQIAAIHWSSRARRSR